MKTGIQLDSRLRGDDTLRIIYILDSPKPFRYNSCMSKLDEIKEILTTLRIWLSLAFGAEVVLIGGLIGRYDSGKEDAFSLFGVGAVFVLAILIVYLSREISKKTKETRNLK